MSNTLFSSSKCIGGCGRTQARDDFALCAECDSRIEHAKRCQAPKRNGHVSLRYDNNCDPIAPTTVKEFDVMTEKQSSFIRSLLAERTGNPQAEKVRALLNSERINGGVTKKVATSAIDALLAITPAKAPVASAEPKRNTRGVNKFAGKCDLCGKHVAEEAGERDLNDDGKWVVFHVGACPTSFPFAEGRYAILASDATDENDLRFYHLTDGQVFVQASSELHLVHSAARQAIIDAIAADPSAASRRYGRSLGKCGVCARTLTNKASREAGIGPICEAKTGL